MTLLAVVVAIARAHGTGAAVLTISLSITFIAVMILFVRPLLSRLARYHEDRGQHDPCDERREARLRVREEEPGPDRRNRGGSADQQAPIAREEHRDQANEEKCQVSSVE